MKAYVSLWGFQAFIQSIHYPLRGVEHKGIKQKKANHNLNAGNYMLFHVFYLNVLPKA